MGRNEVDAALERLVSQFASPYDFLRELVQNSMDAGSDRVEVSLERHLEAQPGADGKDAVFELVIMDTGVGMDESIIDGALTRLFASTKTDDRTMAGGFGVGFVSVFAWEPDVLLLQTGRGGESWELTFYSDRRFEKSRLDLPVEGTTITLLRRADASAYGAVVEAVRDSLWRWCRFAEVEVTFEDLNEGDGPELIEDAPTPEDYAVSRSETVGDGHVRVAFGIPPSAVMMRRGLILEEGEPVALVPSLENEGRSAEHLALWVDSPELETTLARDSIVQSKGRERIEARVIEQIRSLRRELLDELEGLCTRVEPWGAHERARYANLHAHLELEWSVLADAAANRRILRAYELGGGAALGGQLAWSPAELQLRCRGGPLLVVADAVDEGEALGAGWGGAWPVLEGESADESWVRAWGERLALRVAQWRECRGSVRAADEEALESEQAFLVGVRDALARLTASRVELRISPACDGESKNPPLCAWDFTGAALTSRRGLPRDALSNLVLDRRHLLVQAALRSHARAPLTARITLISAILSCIDNEVAPKALQERMWEERERG